MEGQIHLSGQITDWSINDLLRIMQVTKKTGSLDIEGDRRARIHFRDGNVTGAELIGPEGSLIDDDRSGVAEILFVLSTLESGSFAVGAADGPDTPGWSIEDVLADVDALRSLEDDLVDAGLFESDGVRLVADIDESITITPDDWTILASLVPVFTFDDLKTRMGRGGAVRVLHALRRMGVADVVGEEVAAEEVAAEEVAAEEVAPVSDDPIWLEELPEEAEAKTGASAEETSESEADSEPVVKQARPKEVPGVSAPASTTLTDGVYDEIRRLRGKVAEK